MNTQQRNYAIARVNEIEKKKLAELSTVYHRSGITITDEQRFELVRDRKVKLRTDITSISRYDDVIAVFDFSKYVRAAGPDPVVFEPAAALVKAEAGRVRDKIMLGDAAEALALLEVFATMGAA